MRPAFDPLARGLLTDDALPLYSRVAARLWDDVSAAGARAGDRLPSERTLSQRYTASRVTLRAALAELEGHGLVHSSPARGWFVARDVDPASPEPRSGPSGQAPSIEHTVEGFADYARQRGLATRSRVLGQAVRPAAVAEAETLRIAPGAELFEMHRLRFLDGLVVVLEHNRLPLALCPSLATTDFAEASLYATLRAADPPQVPRTAEYAVEARRPLPGESELLEVDDSMPMLVATQLAFNGEGRPLELTVATYRGDRYRFRASIAALVGAGPGPGSLDA